MIRSWIRSPIPDSTKLMRVGRSFAALATIAKQRHTEDHPHDLFASMCRRNVPNGSGFAYVAARARSDGADFDLAGKAVPLF